MYTKTPWKIWYEMKQDNKVDLLRKMSYPIHWAGYGYSSLPTMVKIKIRSLQKLKNPAKNPPHRKHKIINGKIWLLDAFSPRKSAAKSMAETTRYSGFNARVVKGNGRWEVYRRRK